MEGRLRKITLTSSKVSLLFLYPLSRCGGHGSREDENPELQGPSRPQGHRTTPTLDHFRSSWKLCQPAGAAAACWTHVRLEKPSRHHPRMPMFTWPCICMLRNWPSSISLSIRQNASHKMSLSIHNFITVRFIDKGIEILKKF